MNKEIINLKPIGSMISHSELTETNYHVIKFYNRVEKTRTGLIHRGFEAVDKHKLGDCKFCAVEED